MITREPRHPNTALLVGPIPWPNPDRRWRAQPIDAHHAAACSRRDAQPSIALERQSELLPT
jgi:hypothetical protein